MLLKMLGWAGSCTSSLVLTFIVLVASLHTVCSNVEKTEKEYYNHPKSTGKSRRSTGHTLSDYFKNHGDDLHPGELLDGPMSLPVTFDGQVTQMEQTKSSKNNVLMKDPTYLLAVPRKVHAGKVYRVATNILLPSPALMVQVTIYRNNIELASVERECDPNVLHLLDIMVPSSSGPGRYRLKVEGSEVGWLSGTAFTREAELEFQPLGPTVMVHTDKPVYKQGDTVRVRVVGVDAAGRPAKEAVDVYILTPRGVMVKRWLARQCGEQAVLLHFPLSDEPETGVWTLRVESSSSVTQHLFNVEQHFQTRFEIDVQVPAYLPATAPSLEGTVYANYTSGAPVSGNITLKASIRSLSPHRPHLHYSPDPALVMHVTSFYGVFPFKFHISDFGDLLPSRDIEETEITVSAQIGDMIWNILQTGYSKTKLLESKIRLKFLGDSPYIIRPAMPFKFYLSATEGPSSLVPEWRLTRHRLLVTPEVTLRNGRKVNLHPRTVKRLYHDKALWTAEIDLHVELADHDLESEVSSLKLTAELKETQGNKYYATLIAITHQSPAGRFLQVSTSTRDPQVGEYIILHVRSNFYLESFRYLLLSKGMIVEAGQEKMEASLRTFPLALDPMVSGSATVVVYWTGRGGTLVADALTFPVNSITREKIAIDIVTVEKKQIDLQRWGKLGTRVPRDLSSQTGGRGEEEEEIQLESLPEQNISMSDKFDGIVQGDGELKQNDVDKQNITSGEQQFNDSDYSNYAPKEKSDNMASIISLNLTTPHAPEYSTITNNSLYNDEKKSENSTLNSHIVEKVSEEHWSNTSSSNAFNNFDLNSTSAAQVENVSTIIFPDVSTENISVEGGSLFVTEDTSGVIELLALENDSISSIAMHPITTQLQSDYDNAAPLDTQDSFNASQVLIYRDELLEELNKNGTSEFSKGNGSYQSDIEVKRVTVGIELSRNETQRSALYSEHPETILELDSEDETTGIEVKDTATDDGVEIYSLGSDEKTPSDFDEVKEKALKYDDYEDEEEDSNHEDRSNVVEGLDDDAIRSHSKRDVRGYEYADDIKEDFLQLIITGVPGSRVSVSGYGGDTFGLMGGSGMSHSQVLSSLSLGAAGDGEGTLALSQEWSAPSGDVEQILRIPRSSLGYDANETFSFADLLVLTDGAHWDQINPCPHPQERPCLMMGCYPAHAQCDGHWDCIDGIDERMCSKPNTEPEHHAFLLSRQNRLSRHLERPWLWSHVTLNSSGVGTITVPRPHELGSHLSVSGFGLHKEKGISLLEKPVQWVEEESFQLRVEAPDRVSAWEHIGVRVTALNKHVEDVTAHITLAHSTDYKFIALEDFDVTGFEGKRRRFADGEHQHTIHVGSGGSITLYLPIIPLKLGEIPVTVTAVIPGKKLRARATMLVEPSGAEQQRHTSILLDLSNRPYYFTFLDINVPLGVVPESTRAHVAVSGDTLSPIPTMELPRGARKGPLDGDTSGQLTSPVATSVNYLNLPETGSESSIFTILLTCIQLQHRERLGLPPPSRQVYNSLQLHYQTVLAHQGSDGGFRFFKRQSPSSVWLTALAARALTVLTDIAPHIIYVDPQTKDRAVRFVLSQQTTYGVWWEPSSILGARQLQPSAYSFANETTHGLNLSTSAHTLLQLLTLTDLPSPMDEAVSLAISRGQSWLEHNLHKVERASRPLEAALVALALHEAKSSYAEAAFGILARNARQEVKYVYFGEDLVPLPSYRVESQRPHLQPRANHKHDSGNIAATAYALRVYTARGELMAPAIVRWLHSQRAHDYGWMSTQDTIAAWEALQQYSLKMETHRDTQLAVTVEPLADVTSQNTYPFTNQQEEMTSHTFYIGDRNLLELQTQRVDPEWGSARVRAKGSGFSVLQLTAKYHVTDEHHLQVPPVRAFTVTTKAYPSTETSIQISACVRWVFRSAGEMSGVTVLQITLPTGYGADRRTLDELIHAPMTPTLKKVHLHQRTVNFFFDQLDSSNTCVELTAERWFPVANLTNKLPVSVFEFHAPELKTTEFLDMSAVTFDICQVCGSYQCSNCPEPSFYLSSSPSASSSLLFILGTSVLSALFSLLNGSVLTELENLLSACQSIGKYLKVLSIRSTLVALDVVPVVPLECVHFSYREMLTTNRR